MCTPGRMIDMLTANNGRVVFEVTFPFTMILYSVRTTSLHNVLRRCYEAIE